MRSEILPFLMLVAAPSLRAQRLITPHSTPGAPAAPLAHFDSTGAGAGNHAAAGALIGGLALGSVYAVVTGLCEESCTHRGRTIVLAVGAGAILGATIPKAPADLIH